MIIQIFCMFILIPQGVNMKNGVYQQICYSLGYFDIVLQRTNIQKILHPWFNAVRNER